MPPPVLTPPNSGINPNPGFNHSFYFGGRHGSAEVSPVPSPNSRINLRRQLHVGAWNIQSLSDDDRLPVLSAELRRMKLAIAALSEVRRPGEGTTSSGGYTYYWSGRKDGLRREGVAVAILNHLCPAVVRVTPVDERIMVVRMKHTLGFISLIAVYAPTEMGSLDSKEMFYAKLDSITDQCPRGDILIVLGDFNAVTGSERDGYEACVGPHGSGNRNVNSSYFLDYARSRK